MQKLKQDLLDALPRYYDESPEVDAIMGANAIEFDGVRQNARDLLDQLFVRTATWGLADWERVLALPPAPRADLEFRRQRITAKLAGNAPATIKYLTELVNVYVPNRGAKIVEHPADYHFEAVVPLSPTNPIDTGDIIGAVEEVKPAHLAFDLVGEMREEITIVGSAYSFGVPYVICNEFRTDDAQGVAANAAATIRAKVYEFDVLYPICGEFFAGEAI